jgi:hypothetical protein
MTTIDTPTRLVLTEPEQRSRYSSSNRAIDFRWTISETPVEHHGKPAVEKVYVTLTCEHYGKREMYNQPEYCFQARLHHEHITEGDGFVMQSIRVGAGWMKIAEEPCQRFSRKRLDTFAGNAMTTLLNMRDDEPVRIAFGEDL